MIVPLTLIGPAAVCAAALLMCQASLTMTSSAFKAGDNRHLEPRVLNALLLLSVERQSESSPARPEVPSLLRPDLRFIRFDSLTLPPIAFTQFCLRYVEECNSPHRLPRGDRLQLTSERWSELDRVNRSVNASILPERKVSGLAAERWSLNPAFGDCNDYAVTKRHQLIAMGWPAQSVLLSEVVTEWGEHHLVMVVRVEGGDLVLDNLTDRILPWFQSSYRWVRMQTPENQNYWASVAGPPGEQLQPRRVALSLRAGA